MKLLNCDSLFQTVDNVSEALFFRQEINKQDKIKVAEFIASRQGKQNAYAGTFAPTYEDMKNDLVLFTGEKIKTSAGKTHVIGEEALRILLKLNVQDANVKNVFQLADENLSNQIEKHTHPAFKGMYCCRTCSSAMWLNLSAGGLKNNSDLLFSGIKLLRTFRDGKGNWKGFPYYYLLYVLNEIEFDLVKDELNYSARLVEKRLRYNRENTDIYQHRRSFLLKEILEKVA